MRKNQRMITVDFVYAKLLDFLPNKIYNCLRQFLLGFCDLMQKMS